MDDSLIQRQVNKNCSEYDQDPSVEPIVEDIKIDHKNANILYRNITDKDDQWNFFCNMNDLVHKEPSDIAQSENCIIKDDILSKIQDIKISLESFWDSDSRLYKLLYRENNDGSSELYIPIKSDKIDDIIVKKIHNSNGEFVAQNIERQLDCPIYKIETMDLYIDQLSNGGNRIYKKKTIRQKNEKFRQEINESDNLVIGNDVGLREFQKSLLAAYSITSLISIISLYIIQNTASLSTTLIIFGFLTTVSFGIFAILPILTVIMTIDYVRAYNKMRKRTYQTFSQVTRT